MSDATKVTPVFVFDEQVKIANPELYSEFDDNPDLIGKITSKRGPEKPGGEDRYAVIWKGDFEPWIYEASELVSVDNE